MKTIMSVIFSIMCIAYFTFYAPTKFELVVIFGLLTVIAGSFEKEKK